MLWRKLPAKSQDITFLKSVILVSESHMLTHCSLVCQPIEFLSDMYLAPLPPFPPPYLSPYEIVVEPSHLLDNNNSFLPVVTEQFFGFI
jgi:hypothetical protein